MMILPLLAAVSISNADDSFNFTHTYVANATVHLTLDIGGLPNNAKMTSDLKEEVKSVDATGATIKFTGKLNPPTPDEGVDNFTSHVGVNGYPETGNINSVAAPFIFLGVASATTGTPVKVGDDLKIHWQSPNKDLTIDEKGKVLSADLAAKTLTIDWTADMDVKNDQSGKFHFKSVYSTMDFGLQSSEGTLSVHGMTATLSFKRV